MMDIHPLLSSPQSDHPDLNFHPQLATFSSRPHKAAMIIDATTHNSSMPVSPKQGETIGADSLNKQEPQLVSSSSWEHISQKTSSSSTSAPVSLPSSSSAIVSQTSWPSSTPLMTSQAHSDGSSLMDSSLQSVNKFQVSQATTEPRCEPVWHDATDSKSLNPHKVPENSKESMDTLDRGIVHNSLNGSIRNCDHPDSSPSSPSQFNSSFEESDQVRPELLPNSDPFSASGINLDGSFERRSRRKPTIEDIVRRVKPPVDAPPYDSEESEIEDDILNDEMMMKMSRVNENDEVDGTAKPALRMMDGYEGDERYKDELRQYSINRLSRLEAVDGIPEDDEDMEMRSEDDLTDVEKSAFDKDVPDDIYNLIHEVKVNAHAMFMKTASLHSPEEAKVRREQYLIQLLSNLRDRCLADGLKPEIIGAILKDVESEIMLINEDYEEMKMKQYMDEVDKHSRDLNGMAPSDNNFLTSPKPRADDNSDSSLFKPDMGRDQRLSPSNPPTFLNSTPSSSSESSLSSPSTSAPNSISSPSSKDIKPIITTISAHGVVSTVIKDDNTKGPPPLINNSGGLPPLHSLASNISETAFSPNMFPGNGKMGSWFPGGILHNMPIYPFSPSGSPLDHALARKFLPFEGKMGESIDKDYLKCQFCERTFRRQKNLENHVESTHQGKNPLKTRRDTSDMYFKCSHCPYTTKHQSNLYVHLRIHTGERPYICGACGVQYSQSHSLKSHIINKHEGIMSYYIKEKRTRSPRGMGYLSTQIMHDNSIFKLPPPPLLASSMHNTNLDFVTKAIEMAKSEHAQQQQKLQQQHSLPSGLSPPDGHMGSNPSHMANGMPPPLTPNSSLNTSSSNNVVTTATPTCNAKSPSSTPSYTSANHSNNNSNNNSNNSNPLLPSPGGNNPHPSFFMNGHTLPPLMFGEIPPHLRNPNHPPHPHLFPSLPFPPHSSAGFPGNPGMSPLPGLSPNSSSNLPGMHQGMPPHMQMFGNFPHLPASPMPLTPQAQQQIKKEAVSQPSPQQQTQQQQQQQPHHQQQQQQQQQDQQTPLQHPPTPLSSKLPCSGGQPDEAMDLRKKSPPPYSGKEQHTHNYGMCQGKENCAHAAKLKYLRLNVVRMLGILVPNLNFAEKGISAESESVDELLQDVIESNSPEDEILE